jgi:RIO kinase 1
MQSGRAPRVVEIRRRTDRPSASLARWHPWPDAVCLSRCSCDICCGYRGEQAAHGFDPRMQPPDSLITLINEGIIDEVVRPLMSGKEAQVYLVRSRDELRVAKVYKEAQKRSFKQKADYTEGRSVRNSRDRRAISKRTRYGREQDEAAWRSAEVDMMYRLSAAGVRVPTPYDFIEGVLVMELVSDENGDPAPRLGDLKLEPAGAQRLFDQILAEVIRMLAAGVVHGDLSDFNVLVGADGPVVIDFPQAVEASSNQNARKLLLRDVDNLHHFIAPFFPDRLSPPFAQEMWRLYERGELTPDTKLKGRFRTSTKAVNTEEVLGLIADADDDERRRRLAAGSAPGRGARPAPGAKLALGPRVNAQGGNHSGAQAPRTPQPQRRVQPEVVIRRPRVLQSEQLPPEPQQKPLDALSTEGAKNLKTGRTGTEQSGPVSARKKSRRRRRRRAAGAQTPPSTT